MDPKSNITGVLLAGGLSRRMGGGDKCLVKLAARPLLEHVIEKVAPQVETLILNANGDPKRFSRYGLPVVADVIEGFAGPLAGVLTGMEWAAKMTSKAEWVATFPTDSPFLPRDLVSRLLSAVLEEGADMACAVSGGRHHPVIGLWPVRLAENLRKTVEAGNYKVDSWTGKHKLATVTFPSDPVDPFFNVNHPKDADRAEAIMGTLG